MSFSLQATLKLFIAAQNVAAHLELDQGKRDEQAVTVTELSRTIGEKIKGSAGCRDEKERRATVVGEQTCRGEVGLSSKLSTMRSKLSEAKQKIEAFASELRTCYDYAMKDYIGSVEYREKLAT
ncbi:uncharacterized protein Pyn_23037 [Prunus yedoensis var. nudiflora]|uniref:Uncharacterized protein n=1 Tax=Prunus yedoensis var. nudiflora TaxID=2094558 RepID=A0A314V3Q0_PRUYE|nr:uncharacterized protein Pyn_23037 [Prunus yedoensis var. nudiflora]